MQLKALKAENEASNGSFLSTLGRTNDINSLSLSALKSMQSQLRSHLEEIEKVTQSYESDMNKYWCNVQF